MKKKLDEQGSGNGSATPTGSVEDRKTAVSMWVTLSSQIIAAVVAVMAVEGAFVTYVLDKRQPGWVFFSLVVLSLVFFVGSISVGGAGINRLTIGGYKGQWELKGTSSYFGRQTLAAVIGLGLFFLSALFFSGATKTEEQTKEIKTLQDIVKSLESRNKELSSQLEELRSAPAPQSDELKALEERVNKLAEEVNKTK